MKFIFYPSVSLATDDLTTVSRRCGAASAIVIACALLLSAGALRADDEGRFESSFDREMHVRTSGVCSGTARAAFRACRHEVRDDFWIEVGNCLNSSGVEQCIEGARAHRFEAFELCDDQRAARFELCDLIGEAAYDPVWWPGDFVDPLYIGTAVDPNPHFPLIPGTVWIYEAEFLDEEGETVKERITVEVKSETKRIGGVDCIVVNDVVEEDGEVIEDTDDWYAQDIWRNVWYCGEIAENFESFEGDDPEEPELVDIEGSWKGFREGAKPGIIMQGEPRVGQVYRQEIALGDAEDAAEVISVSGSESVNSGIFSCDGTCVVTREFTPLEPDVNDQKYYKRDVGLILEVDVESLDRVELVEMKIP